MIEYQPENHQGVMDTISKTLETYLDQLDKTKLKAEGKNMNILAQKLLQKIMLFYIIDIEKKLELIENELISTYPTELISSLKIITDLYLRLKESNRILRIKDDGDNYDKDFVF